MDTVRMMTGAWWHERKRKDFNPVLWIPAVPAGTTASPAIAGIITWLLLTFLLIVGIAVLMDLLEEKYTLGQLELADVGIISIISGLLMLIVTGSTTLTRLKEIYKKSSGNTGDEISKLTSDFAGLSVIPETAESRCRESMQCLVGA